MSKPTPSGARTAAGVADAEDGAVILDGPDGVAVTMTHEAATGTGESLLAAAAKARSNDAPQARADRPGRCAQREEMDPDIRRKASVLVDAR